jgi:hypothetical protein
VQAPAHRYWETYANYLRDEDRRHHVDDLCPPDLADRRPSTLRLLDVVVWMSHSNSDNAHQARKTAGYNNPPR